MDSMDLKTYLDGNRGEGKGIAEQLGVHPVMVSQWANDKKQIPAERCPGIERATNGAVTCETLRPDVHWQRVPDSEWPHANGRPCIDIAAPEVTA